MKRTLSLALALSSGLFAAAALWPQAPAAAQAYAEIVFLQGSDIMVLNKGAPVSLPNPIGARLGPGDLLQTGPRTQVELLVQPRGARLRLSENTVLSIRDFSGGSTSLELLYGRLRSKVDKIAGISAPFELRASSVVAGVRGTDFGCDLVAARPGATAAVVVYCFEGEVQVAAQPRTEAAAPGAPESAAPAPPAPVLVAAGTMATVETGAAVPEIVTSPISQEIEDFWKDREFSSVAPGQSSAPLPKAAPVAATASQATGPLPAPDLGVYKRGVERKNAVAVATIGFVAAGAAMQGAAILMRNSNPSMGNTLAMAGAICSAVGIPVLIFSISIDPFAAK